MKKVTFAIPTLFGIREPNYLDTVIKSLIRQCKASKIDYTIYVAGRKNALFDSWENPKVIKEYIVADDKHDDHEVSAYLNAKIDTTKPGEYFCFFHDDLFVDDTFWIKMFIELYEQKQFKCGVLGLLSHSQSMLKRIYIGLYLCLYTNGALFVSSELAKEIKFNELFKYECGDMDFSYEAIMRGYKNYYVGIPVRHYMSPYSESLKFLENHAEKLNIDRRNFNAKWENKMSKEFMTTI